MRTDAAAPVLDELRDLADEKAGNSAAIADLMIRQADIEARETVLIDRLAGIRRHGVPVAKP